MAPAPAAWSPLWRTLFTAERPVRYLSVALLFDLPVTAALWVLVRTLTGAVSPSFAGTSLLEIFVVMCVVTPFLETMVLSVILEILKLFLRAPLAIATAGALVCAALHSLATPVWGLVIAWSFFLQSLCYLTWQQRSWAAAIAMTFALHALHNLFPTLLLAVERWRASP